MPTLPPTPAPNPTLLRELLARRFEDSRSLLRFLDRYEGLSSALPGPDAPMARVVDDAAEALIRRGLVNSAFYEGLAAGHRGGQALVREAALYDLFRALFEDGQALSRFFGKHGPYRELRSALPGPDASLDDAAEKAARLLVEHGLVDAALFKRLGAERPSARGAVRETARVSGVTIHIDLRALVSLALAGVAAAAWAMWDPAPFQLASSVSDTSGHPLASVDVSCDVVGVNPVQTDGLGVFVLTVPGKLSGTTVGCTFTAPAHLPARRQVFLQPKQPLPPIQLALDNLTQPPAASILPGRDASFLLGYRTAIALARTQLGESTVAEGAAISQYLKQLGLAVTLPQSFGEDDSIQFVTAVHSALGAEAHRR